MSEKYITPRVRKCHPLPAGWNALSETNKKTEDIYGIRIRKVLQKIEPGGDYTGLYAADDWSRVGQFVAKRMFEDQKYFENIFEQQAEKGKELSALAKNILNTNLELADLNKLFEFYRQIESAWVIYDQYNVTSWFIASDYFQELVKNELLKFSITEDETNILFTPTKPSFSAEEELLIYKICLEIKKNNYSLDKLPKNLEDKISELVERFFWIPFGYDGPLIYDRNYYLKSINEIVTQKDITDIDVKIKQIESYEVITLSKQEEIIKKRQIPASLVLQIKKIHILAQITDERKEYQFQSHVAFHKVLDYMAKKLAVDAFGLKYVTLSEIKENVNKPELIFEISKRRMNSTIIFSWFDGGLKILEGDEVKKVLANIELDNESANIIKGQIGCRGSNNKTVGRVRVLRGSLEIDKLLAGEVLVTSMTTPEFVPAMRKSSAIVTNEGGITCHAAIVSRELNIPCIISTKNATKVLKDGDLVEIDTVTGTVTLIK